MIRLGMGYRLIAGALSLAAVSLSFAGPVPDAPKTPPPVRALLVIGGGYHEYAKQKDILPKGISKIANVQWKVSYDADKSETHVNPVFQKEDWSKDFDVVVHDECSAKIVDLKVIDSILKPHQDGLPAVILHCGMHSYRSAGWPKTTPWFEFTGLITTGHRSQLPISISYVDKESPITKGLEDWTTVNEELYNNMREGKKGLNDTAHALARGKQTDKNNTYDDVITWTNTYKEKTKVFATTLGHNSSTVGDERYLKLVARGLLWSVGKLNDEYLQPASQVMLDAK